MPGLFGEDDPPSGSGLFEGELPAGPGLFGDAPAPATPQATAYRVLARKYRPNILDDLIGQDALVRTLRNSFAAGRVAHAFMFTGVRGVGKTTTARILARALNCIGLDGTSGPTADPCGVCANCVAILADRHPDVIEIDAASNTGVDYVREIIEATRFKPMQARTKLFIIDEVHMLSKAAFNALLKTLEEPPEHIKFVFATTEIRKVPITVLSRCQRFDLKRVSMIELAGHYGRIAIKEGVNISEAALEMIARAADGSVRDGLSLLDQAIARAEDGEIGAESVIEMLGLADRALVFDLLYAVMSGNTAAALDITDRAYAVGADLGVMLADLLDLVHTLTRIKAVPALKRSAELPETERVRGSELADKLPVSILGRAWQMLLKGIAEVEHAPDRRAAAEMVLIRLAHAADLPPPGDLVKQLIANGGAASAGPGLSPGGSGGGFRAIAGGGAVMQAVAMPVAAPAPGPRITSFRELAALVHDSREPMLHAHLVHSVHPVRFAPPVIEIRVEPAAPRDFASKLGEFLLKATGDRWTVVLSAGVGEPTLAEKSGKAENIRREESIAHPLVQAILEAFPGAQVQAVHETGLDLYGLPAEQSLVSEADMPEFAPADAEFASNLED